MEKKIICIINYDIIIDDYDNKLIKIWLNDENIDKIMWFYSCIIKIEYEK